MFSSLTMGQYIPGESLLHRLDPRTKVVCVLVVGVAVLVALGWAGFVPAVLITIAAIALSGFSPRLIIRGLRPLWLILTVTFLLQLLLTPGEVLLELGPLHISWEGLEAGSQLFLRLGLLIFLASLLTQTTTPVSLTAGLESLLAPLTRVGVPAHELSMMMTIALSFIPTLMQEADILVKAQRSRGAGLAGGPAGWIKNMIPLLVPLFAGAMRRADDLAIAMEARCYRGGANRTRIRSLRFGPADYVSVAVCLAALAGTLVLR
ncbi:MAG: energy-coupling factor transporter transmembrane component T [Desulfotomaculaceae bacterium]|nr:energy-coupling factor transporter transmembrane component T [Desulfotomaculaceae bacterium]